MLMRQVVIAVTKRTSLLGALTSIRHARCSGMHPNQACISPFLYGCYICTYMEESSKDLTPSHDKLKRIVWFLLPTDNVPLLGRGCAMCIDTTAIISSSPPPLASLPFTIK